MTRILILLALTFTNIFTQAQPGSNSNYQKEFFCDQLANLKNLLSSNDITSDNYIEHLEHNGPIAVSMLRNSLESYVSEDFFTPKQQKQLVQTVEKEIFKWDGKEVKGDIYIFGEHHNSVNCLERQKDIIELYNRGKISLGLEGVYSSNARSLHKYNLNKFSKHLFGLESVDSYSFATLIKFQQGLLKKFITYGFDKTVIVSIAKFSNQNRYFKNAFKKLSSKENKLAHLWQRLVSLADNEISLDDINDKEVNLSISFYEMVAEKLINDFNFQNQSHLSIEAINKTIAEFIKNPQISINEQGYDALVLKTIDLPREKSFLYTIQRHISFNILRKPMAIIIGDDHVERLSQLLKSKYPFIKVHSTKRLQSVNEDSKCTDTLGIL